MENTVSALLSEWETFYVILGSAAGALTGLQFVVVVLSAELHTPGSGSTVRTFSVHVLLENARAPVCMSSA